MKKILMLLVVFILLSASLMAGGGQQNVGSSSTAGKVEIRATYWGDARRFELYDKIIKEFEKVHTNVTVIREPSSWNEYFDKLSVQAAGGNAPDFLCMHPQYAADYIPKGILEPLDKYVSDKVISLDGWARGTIDTGIYNGINYMLAMGLNINSCFVNTTGFKNLNIAPPSFDWTWEDAKRIGLQVRAAFDAQGKKTSWMLPDLSSNIINFRHFVRGQFGRELYSPTGDIACRQSDVEAWYAMFREFMELGIIPDAATTTEFRSATLEQSLLAKDRVLMVWNPSGQMWQYSVTFPDKQIAMIRMASPRGGPLPPEWPQGAHYGIFSKSSNEKKLAAAQLINFWLNDERSLVLYGFDQGVPANTPLVDKVIVPNLDAAGKAFFNFVNTLQTTARPTNNPPPGAQEIDALFLRCSEQVQYGTMTPAVAAKEFFEQAVAIRARASR